MPRYNQTTLSMVGSSGITVVNTIKIAEKNADSARTTSETAPLFPCFCVWRSQREFLCFVSTFPCPAGAAVAIWSCFSKTLVLFNSFFSFPCLFLTFFLLRWCSPKVHFVFQHSLFFSAAVAVLLFMAFRRCFASYRLLRREVIDQTAEAQHLTEENQDY